MRQHNILRVCVHAIPYPRFGTSCWVHFSSRISWPLKVGPICCPETSVRYYRYTLRNIQGERRSHPIRGGSLESGTQFFSVSLDVGPSIFFLVELCFFFQQQCINTLTSERVYS